MKFLRDMDAIIKIYREHGYIPDLKCWETLRAQAVLDVSPYLAPPLKWPELIAEAVDERE